MKIVIASDTFFPEQVNGVAKVAYRSARILEELGHEVKVVSINTVPSLPFWGYRGERFALPLGKGMREIVRFKPDIIHSHTPFIMGGEALRAAKKLGVPLVGTHHTFFDHYLKHIYLDLPFMRYISWKYLTRHYNQASLVLSPSKALLKGMKAFGLTSDTLFFPNSVDTSLFVPANTEEKSKIKKAFGISGLSVAYMGRLSYEKSIDVLIDAFALVHAEKPDSTLMLIGDGPELLKLKKQVKKLALTSCVIFTGMLHGSDLVRALQAHDVFVTASKSENMPLSVIEAMAVGLPVVGVRALGIPEVVLNQENGFIVEPDDRKAIAQSILKLLSDPILRRRFRDASRARALQYGEKEYGRALEKVYYSLLKK